MSAKDDYKLGNRVYSGDDVRAVARATRVEGLQNLSRAQVAGDQYSRTSGLLRAVGPGWVVNRQIKNRFFKGTGARTFPWKISIGETLKVAPGTVNGLLPSNIFDVFPANIQGTNVNFVKLNIITDGVQPIGASISFDSQQPDPIGIATNIAPGQFSILIGVTVGNAAFQLLDGLVQVTPINMISTDRTGSAPGEPFYDNNYSWNVTQY